MTRNRQGPHGLPWPTLASEPRSFSAHWFVGVAAGPSPENSMSASLSARVLRLVRQQAGNSRPLLDQVSRAIAAARRAGARSPSPALQGGAPGPRSALGWFFGLFQTLRPVRTRRIEAEASSCKTDGQPPTPTFPAQTLVAWLPLIWFSGTCSCVRMRSIAAEKWKAVGSQKGLLGFRPGSFGEHRPS